MRQTPLGKQSDTIVAMFRRQTNGTCNKVLNNIKLLQINSFSIWYISPEMQKALTLICKPCYQSDQVFQSPYNWSSEDIFFAEQSIRTWALFQDERNLIDITEDGHAGIAGVMYILTLTGSGASPLLLAAKIFLGADIPSIETKHLHLPDNTHTNNTEET